MSAIAPPSTLPRVLVVDDELGPRESLRMLLKPAFHIQTAENGRAALDVLEWFRPDIVIMELEGPELARLDNRGDPTIDDTIIKAYPSPATAQHAPTNAASNNCANAYWR